MKASIFAVAVACALAAPVATYAQQTDAPQTRAEARTSSAVLPSHRLSTGRSAPVYTHDADTRSIYFGH